MDLKNKKMINNIDFKKLYFELLENNNKPKEIQDERVYIHCPYKYKESAKKLGAKFDPEKKQFYTLKSNNNFETIIKKFEKSNFNIYGKYLLDDLTAIDELEADEDDIDKSNKPKKVKKEKELTEEELLELELENLINKK